MPRRVRHHVNPLKSDFLVTGAARLALPSGALVEVELGCADARWLFERAAAECDHMLVGLEIRRELVRKVNARAAALALAPRVRAVYANISQDLERLFAGGEVSRFVLNFPDPWFKRRQKKRRLVTPELVDVLWHKLTPRGEIFVQSDVWDLALDAMAVLEAADDKLENARGPWSFLRENPFGARSKREANCAERDQPVWRMLYRKRGVSGLPARTPPAP